MLTYADVMLTYADADGVFSFAGSAPSAASRISSVVPDKTGQVCLKASTKVQILTQKLVQIFKYRCGSLYRSTNSDAEAGIKVQILTQKLVQKYECRCRR